MSWILLCLVIWCHTALGQYVPEPYGWACYRTALKREWPACKSASKSKLQECLCELPEFVQFTETCLQVAVANDSNPEQAMDLARSLSLCRIPTESLPYETGNKPALVGDASNSTEELPLELVNGKPLTRSEIAVAVRTAEWRMTNDRRAERSGAALVGFWAVVILGKYLSFLIGGIVPDRILNPILIWRPVKLVRARLLNPALGKRHHSEPWFKKLGIRLPTRFLTLILILFAGLNYALIFTNYPYSSQNFIYTTRSQQRNKSLAIRSAFMIMWKLPLVFGFTARNNLFVLFHHPWSLDTFNKFHKWIARITVIDIIIHGIAMTLVKAEQGLYGYVWSVEYWQWGIVGLLTATIIVLQSMYWISRINYEIFKGLHVVLVVVFTIAAWHHVQVLPYGTKHAYAIVAIWGFDHAARLVRLVLAWRVKASLEHISDSMSVIKISPPPMIYKQTKCSFLFLHIPKIHMFWQSHPFTAVTIKNTEGIGSDINAEESKYSSTIGSSMRNSFSYKGSAHTSVSHGNLNIDGRREDNSCLMIAIKHCNGITKKIAQMKEGPINLYLDGPYGARIPLHRFKQVICIAGGIGITAHLSYMQYLIDKSPAEGISIKLYWAVKDIEGMQWALDLLGDMVPWIQVEVFISGTSRGHTRFEHNRWPVLIHYNSLSCEDIVKSEVERVKNSNDSKTTSTAIFACGPSRLNDDARLATCWAIEHATSYFAYFEESFSW